MSRTGKIILSLFVVGLLMQSGLCLSKRIANDYESSSQQTKPMPFRAGNEYLFKYNSQIASGLIGPNDENDESLIYLQDNNDNERNPQKVVTRVQADVKINFVTENRATLQLEKPRAGYLNNKAAADPKRVQPMAMFEAKTIDDKTRNQLEMPCEFVYSDGVVERVKFHREDSTWSKNVKRAVLNLIQLNLKRKNIDSQTWKQQEGGRANGW